MNNINKKGGLIRLVLLVIVAILILSYFNIDLKTEVEKPQTQSNIGYVLAVGGQIWHEYLSKPVLYFWNNIFLDLLWSAFIKNMDLIKQGQSPTNFETNHLQPYPGSNP